MFKNKPRLYVVCFFRAPKATGNPDRYHWALASGRKGDMTNGKLLYHVRTTISADGVRWQLEEPPRKLSPSNSTDLLTYTAVAKIIDLGRLEQICGAIPIEIDAPWEVFNCQTWVERALAAIVADGACIGTNAIPSEWTTLRDQCISFSDPVRQLFIQGKNIPQPRPTQQLIGS
ncbi:hypothetical protein GLAREA_10003 [Glarea lozoyensis ATCC 20868]|uniref:Uncharacterized protein n=1 Tax=Glarea lozoyensis (strain ATCC 20868 / MF5171) TaxID=1116229 RepID=S3DB49_GLAL2|nr:uncharacterized protein GLAREA_10003 [Glarea lozoyensis ATCC 20868]EPE34309.1 hypothetical protein GLAREA_10003 [Glarea lozoyensis ATCC 20868]